MRYEVGDRIVHPSEGKEGLILEVRRNPACLMRFFVIRWDDDTEDELEELQFGPMED